ncbi:hypothetical protein JAO29_15545 [Edaphobacter sp. HDX4]|uniref:hypothetical protein n=1 Tax=Edaphobacter sp. HDX4 TaxID=2794064 RepID=UPI002FE5E94D
MLVIALLAAASCYWAVATHPISEMISGAPLGAVPGVAPPLSNPTPQPTSTVTPQGIKTKPATTAKPPQEAPSVLYDRDKIGASGGRWLAIILSTAVAFIFLVYRLSRPRRPEEAKDPETFSKALQSHSQDIFDTSKTTREVRRFLNYLRLVATPTSETSKDSIQDLRENIPKFDEQLVELATGAKIPKVNDWVSDFYRKQCELFVLDPTTFRPLEAITSDLSSRECKPQTRMAILQRKAENGTL